VAFLDRLKAEHELRVTTAQILAGATVLVGLFFTAQTYRLQQDAQITDRINKAVEQLGSEHPDVSMAAVHQLGRIADDSPRDHWPMLQILMAYIERHVPLPDLTVGQMQNRCDPTSPYDMSRTADHKVQAVATVLRLRKVSNEHSPAYLNRSCPT